MQTGRPHRIDSARGQGKAAGVTLRAFPLLALPLLAACAGQPGGSPRPSANFAPPPPAHVLNLPGLQGVIGADARELIRQFGQPRLDVTEGDARKLQFSGEAKGTAKGTDCVLDAYLYPPAGGGEPSTTYVDARSRDGREVDRARCVEALRKR